MVRLNIVWPLSAWMIACLVLSNAYSGIFYSLLALPQTDPPIDTVHQFLQYILVTDKKVQLVSNAYTEALFLKATPENELYYQIGQRFNKYQKRLF